MTIRRVADILVIMIIGESTRGVVAAGVRPVTTGPVTGIIVVTIDGSTRDVDKAAEVPRYKPRRSTRLLEKCRRLQLDSHATSSSTSVPVAL